MGGQASHSAVIASNATLDAKQTDHTVSGLADATEKIGKVLALIQEIANRTNLLALNATIESARAGEHGKGFAVVAGEVKALSMQTTAATREIGEQIEAIQSASQGSVSAIKKIAETITEINTAASAISHAVGDQQNTAQNIARSVQEAARYAEIVSSNIAGVKQVATTTGSASVQVLSAAEDFGLRAEALRSEIDSFFARLRAA
jgi:methyl-accepting chemotaxis protein